MHTVANSPVMSSLLSNAHTHRPPFLSIPPSLEADARTLAIPNPLRLILPSHSRSTRFLKSAPLPLFPLPAFRRAWRRTEPEALAAIVLLQHHLDLVDDLLELELEAGGGRERRGLRALLHGDALRLQHARSRLDRLDQPHHLLRHELEVRRDKGEHLPVEPREEGARLADNRGDDHLAIEAARREHERDEDAEQLLQRGDVALQRLVLGVGRQVGGRVAAPDWPQLRLLHLPQQRREEHAHVVRRGGLGQERLLGALAAVAQLPEPLLGRAAEQLERIGGEHGLALKERADQSPRRLLRHLLRLEAAARQKVLGGLGEAVAPRPFARELAARRRLLHLDERALQLEQQRRHAEGTDGAAQRLEKVKCARARRLGIVETCAVLRGDGGATGRGGEEVHG
eukprot:4660996-Pleurochrysis_carterae.AAC.6